MLISSMDSYSKKYPLCIHHLHLEKYMNSVTKCKRVGEIIVKQLDKAHLFLSVI